MWGDGVANHNRICGEVLGMVLDSPSSDAKSGCIVPANTTTLRGIHEDMISRRFLLILLFIGHCASAETAFRAGAATSDISPTKFPTPVNGSMKGGFAQGITDPLLARCLALKERK